VANEFDSSVAVIAYLTTGRFAIPPDDSLHLAPYASPVKTLVLDGRDKVDIATLPMEQYYETFVNSISLASSESTYVTLAASGEIAGDSGFVVAKIAVDSTVPGADLRLVAVLTEDSVTTTGMFAVRFDKIARAFLPDYQGRPFTVARSDTLYDTLRFACTGYRARKLGAALFVKNSNSPEVLQAAVLRRFVLK
jgi:hypothetical protein